MRSAQKLGISAFVLIGFMGSLVGLAQQQTTSSAQSPARSGSSARTPMFTKDVAPILYKNCVTCHRPGEIAPMSLISYSDVRPWARAIGQKVSSGAMPPWFADAPRGRFTNDNRLTEDEIDTVTRWAAGGSPQGNATDMPKLPVFTDGWQIGKPDYVFEMPLEFEIPVSGSIDYQSFETPVPFTETVWVQAVEARASDPEHVHHITAAVIEPKDAPRRTNAVVTGGASQTDAQRTATERAEKQQGVPFVTQARGEGPHVFPIEPPSASCPIDHQVEPALHDQRPSG
jgi:hypothetical protein